MGLAVLDYINDIIIDRKQICEIYHNNIDSVKHLELRSETSWNYSYFPVIFETEEKLLKAELLLKENQIIARRYFYPSLSTLSYVMSAPMEVAESVSKRILCLPIYKGLELVHLNKISQIINAVC
jgi:dTDP-4-amino-4,6-dideoxygalactose transaminase